MDPITDYLQSHLSLQSFHLGRDGIEVEYLLGRTPKRATIRPYVATACMVDAGFILDRRIYNEDQQDLWVQIETEGVGANGEPRQWWITWQSFAMSTPLSAYWAKQILIEYLQREELKFALWYAQAQEVENPQLN